MFKREKKVFWGDILAHLVKNSEQSQQKGLAICPPVKEVFLFSSSLFYFSKWIALKDAKSTLADFK